MQTLARNANQIHWLLPEKLGGVAMPGRDGPIDQDLSALRDAGVDLLITLTAEWRPPVALLRRYDIASLHVEIEDFTPPTVAQARHICAVIAQYLEADKTVVLHCKAGKGRTGTLLASSLISKGQNADMAVKICRAAYNEWIETDGQLAFLYDFAKALQN